MKVVFRDQVIERKPTASPREDGLCGHCRFLLESWYVFLKFFPDMIFASSTGALTAAAACGGDMFGEMDGWVNVEAEIADGDGGGTTKELDGLLSPPSGLTISAAKGKVLED